MKIFYSWQSWTDRKRNFKFIEDALQDAIEQLKLDETLPIEKADRDDLALDAATKGEGGAVGIANTILRKITECEIFVCDVTPVIHVSSKDKTNGVPNPNVSLELGYAAARRGWKQIICLCNTAYGSITDLPFDIQHRKVIGYKLAEDDDIKSAKKQLTKRLYYEIKTILAKPRRTTKEEVDPVTRVKQLIPNESGQIELEDLLREQFSLVYQRFTTDEFYQRRRTITQNGSLNGYQTWDEIFKLYFEVCETALKLVATLCWYGEQKYTGLLQHGLTTWMNYPHREEMEIEWRYTPVVLFLYASGISSIYKRKWENVSQILVKTTTKELHSYPVSQTPLIKHLGKNFYLAVQQTIPDRMPLTAGKFIEPLMHSTFIHLSLSNSEFETAFDLFEVILAVVHLNLEPAREFGDWIPPHIANFDSRSWAFIKQFWYEMGQSKIQNSLIKAGVVDNFETLKDLLKRYDETSVIYARSVHFFNSPNYLSSYTKGLEASKT
jgi:hypothetical protein